ncbi:MAG: hypothetical protein LBF12_00825 [Christensenellaceae bacterium]|jgi:hypothetical protein|nr:hypothetical protein [Christensenellaceae bacterium]
MKRKLTISIVMAILAVLFVSLLVACVPKDADAAKEKMQEKGYVAGSSFLDLLVIGDSSVDDVFYAVKDGEYIFVIWFENKSDAKDYVETAKELVTKYLKDVDTSEFEFKRSGKVVYFGTDGAVKDFTAL